MEQVFWEAFGKHLGNIWEASEKHLGDTWKAFEKTSLAEVDRRRQSMDILYYFKNQYSFRKIIPTLFPPPGVLKVGVTKYRSLPWRSWAGSRDKSVLAGKVP